MKIAHWVRNISVSADVSHYQSNDSSHLKIIFVGDRKKLKIKVDIS